MAKKVYIGVGGKARKVKKIYIGVAGVARKVKKAYIGVGGVARPFWSGGQIEPCGEITALYRGVQKPTGNSTGGYALFAGGRRDSSSYVVDINAYNASLTHTTPVNLSDTKGVACTCKAGSYVLFGGGLKTNSTYSTTVDAINNSLTKTSAPACGSYCCWPTGANAGSAGIMGQSYAYGGSYAVYLYNGSLVQSTGSFSVGRGGLTGGSAGNYALFAGGYIHYTDESKDDVYYNTVDAFNSSLTRSAATGLSVARSETFAVNTGARLLFAGGVKNNGATYLSTVDTYDSSLTRMTAASLPKALANEDMAGVPLDGKALIEASDRMLVYDESMTLTILETFDSTYGTRYEAAAAVVGSYGLFAGGYGNMGGLSSNTRLNLVRAYTI